MSLSDWLRKRTVLVVIGILVLLSAGLYARLRYVNKKLVEQATAAIVLAAARDGAVATAERVRRILLKRNRQLIEAGAAVTAKVDARVERRSEASGSATVEVRRFGENNETGRRGGDVGSGDEELRGVAQKRVLAGRLTLTDSHERFKASADWAYQADSGLRLDRHVWSIHQEFKIETIQFSQRVEGETLWQGYSVTLKEISPKTGAEIERWVVPHDQIDASYVQQTGRASGPCSQPPGSPTSLTATRTMPTSDSTGR